MKKDSPKKLSFIISEIHKNIGARTSGTPDEKVAIRFVKNLFEESSQNVEIETFFCNPRSEQHEITFFATLYCLALLGYIFYPLFAPIILLIYFSTFALVKYFDIRFTDIFAKKSPSHNVITKFLPKNESKSRIIFTANIDSPYDTKIYNNTLRKYILKLREYFFVSFIIFFIISVVKALDIIPIFDDYIYVLPFMWVGFIAFFYDINVSYEKSFGANNNLSGVCVLNALAEYLSAEELEKTEIWLCLFGSKNANLAGSKFFVNKYFKELKDNKETNVINLTGLSGDNLYLITKENISNLTNDYKLVDFVHKTAENIGIKLYRNHININTDSAVFSYEKIPSTTITSLDKDLIPLRYNIKDDLPQYVKEEQLIKVFDICKEIIRVKNEQ